MVEGNWTETENGTTTAFPEPADPNNQLNHISGWKVIFIALLTVLIVTLLSAMVGVLKIFCYLVFDKFIKPYCSLAVCSYEEKKIGSIKASFSSALQF